MPQLPFEIPQSLASYIEQYEKKPDVTIARFKKQLRRRGPDAIGYFVLAWFYYQQNEKEKAVNCALKAKALAPGSPFFEKLHYFFSHPGLFDAWRAPDNPGDNKNGVSLPFVFGLNSLIEKLSQAEKKRIRLDPMFNAKEDEQPFSEKEVDGIVSETLAKVHERQGNNEAAIRVYQILKKVKRERADFYDERIVELEKNI